MRTSPTRLEPQLARVRDARPGSARATRAPARARRGRRPRDEAGFWLVIGRSTPAADEPPRARFLADAGSIATAMASCVDADHPDVTLVSVGGGASWQPRAPSEARARPGRVKRVPADHEVLVELIRSAATLRPPGTDDAHLLDGVLERVFAAEPLRFWRFMATLQSALPPGSGVAIRGSAVEGESYRTGKAFDAAGPGTSDVDLVLLGDEVMGAWQPDAFYLAGVNTWPLDDDHRWIAPTLDPVRTELQALVGRPVAIQAMARWFLDLRSTVQGTRYVLIDG